MSVIYKCLLFNTIYSYSIFDLTIGNIEEKYYVLPEKHTWCNIV